MAIKNQKDFVTGLLFMALGIGFAVGAKDYNMGSAARMGPGYFPTMLGIILAIIGGVLALKSLGAQEHPGGRIGSWALKPMFLIIAANLLFGAMLGGLSWLGLPPMGLIAAIFALTIVACRAGTEFKWKEALILASVLAGGSYVLFVLLLKLPFQVLPAFVTG